MAENGKADTTSLPLDDRPEVHRAGDGSGRTSPISLEEDKDLREGHLPEDRFDDLRMTDLKEQQRQVEEEHREEERRTERGNRGPGEEPGFGQGA